MYEGTFRIGSWDSLSETAKVRVIGALLEAQTSINREFLRQYPNTPKIHQSGVRYQQDPLVCVVINPRWGKRERACEEFVDVPDALERRTADCKSLAAWFVAELRESGEDAKFIVERQHIPAKDLVLYHITVKRGAQGNHREQDISAELGMPT